MIVNPRVPFAEGEVALLRRYLGEGGRVMIFAEYPDRETGLDKLLGEYGLQLDDGIVTDDQLMTTSPYTILAPFLPHAANRVDAVLGGSGDFIPMPRLETVTGLDEGDEGRSWPVITGEYSATPRWESRPVVVGTPISKPAPVFTKLDESVVDDELARAGGH